MPKTVFTPAPEVKDIAERLIPLYHHHLIDCNVRVDYIFSSKVTVKNGKEVWGTCKKVTNLNAHPAGHDDPFFVITIAEPIWEILPPDKREALVDHELCHAWAEFVEDKDGEQVVKISIKPHDVEEFACVIHRHGVWTEDAKKFIEEATKTKKIVPEKE